MYNNLRIVYITTPTKEEARTISKALLEADLAACVNLLDGMESIYKWKGKIEEARETVMIVKTHYSKVKLLTQKVLELHSYEVPCVISLTLTENEGNPEYLDWLLQESKDKP
ncbi:MAG TPA: divalent-cation tolerance protein CutA [Balneolaceae bacterium]|nr:divalent-cation tolerance protein CutA [Balneolaceae bacterium]|tara:strand:- start:49535 stop:49870 length:336 start_codon:yes stop_codon:yes gene_type:complete